MSDPDDSTVDVVRKATRELARRFDCAYWREKDKLGEYPWEFVKAFADGGWLGAMIPEEYGGLGLGLTECGVDDARDRRLRRGHERRLGDPLLPLPARADPAARLGRR